MAQHISIRTPWHDCGWSGYICSNPDHNQACRVLRNIAMARAAADTPQCNQNAENKVSSEDKFVPSCLTESGMFMSDHEMSDVRSHPYIFDTHYKHIIDTLVISKPFSFLATPYKWTLKDNAMESPNKKFYTRYDDSIEIAVGSGSWVSNGINQKRIFDYFYKDIVPNKSLVVAYAKAVPFIESTGRIIIGIGFIDSVGQLQEYSYNEQPVAHKMTSFLWERNIGHTIRADRKNGFLFPFAEIQDYLKKNPQQNPDELVVFAPDDYRDEFSYATEHLSHDALIQTLNKTIITLKKYNDLHLSYGQGCSWDDCIKWCEARLKEIWTDRGAYPGLGAVLSALGVPFGFDVAKVLKEKYKDNRLWDNISKALGNISELLADEQKDIKKHFTKTICEDVLSDIGDQGIYLELLSRISLTLPQAQLLLNDNIRSCRLLCYYADQLTDIHKENLSEDIIANPYILYEKTYRLEAKYQIGIGKIDLAMFPPEYLRNHFFPVSNNYIVSDQDDERRLRAIIVSILESEAATGSSLMLASEIIEAVAKFRSDVPDIAPEIRLKTLQNEKRKLFFNSLFIQFKIKTILENGEERDETALQLIRLKTVNDIIEAFVDSRLKKLIQISDDWESLLNSVLENEQRSGNESEQEARKEKVSAIEKMAQSRISVLTGGAGTGKTTTLAALCMSDIIKNEGILVLAPTGKARVVLSSKLREKKVNHTAKTLFQFLKNTKHCDTNTWSYYLSGEHDKSTPATVIIDECSMLTEEMFGALVEAVDRAKRVIFVGDPNQLPPIGTGKPFFDLVQKLKEQKGLHNYANLIVSNRQKNEGNSALRLDVELSKLFTEDLSTQVGDNLFAQIAKDKINIEFIKCINIDDLPECIIQVFDKINIKDMIEFDYSLGGSLEDKWMNFSDADSIETWQILSPYRNKEVIGTRDINSFVQSRYRFPKPKNHRITNKPLGLDGIRYGEKVINIQNQDRSSWDWGVWSRKKLPMNECEKYIANGEIGIVCGLTKDPDSHIVQFSSQIGYDYNFNSVVTEADSQLELAYALTVHKAQGSGFKTTIFILIEPEGGLNPLVTREMLYTALTRQSDKVYIIYNKEPSEIKKYASAELSDLAHRKTNLFGQAVLRQIKNGWFDNGLIHITADGTHVRSKSEVLVYNMLLSAGKHPVYEQILTLGDISAKPDFTISTDAGNIYWEHLGMLGNYEYKKNWERKKNLYAEHNISEELGNLVLSQDELSGAIDTQKINKLIYEKLN